MDRSGAVLAIEIKKLLCDPERRRGAAVLPEGGIEAAVYAIMQRDEVADFIPDKCVVAVVKIPVSRRWRVVGV